MEFANPVPNTRSIDRRTFEKISRLVYDLTGIRLGPNKEALVCARIGKRIRKLGLPDFKTYYMLLEQDDSGEEVQELLNAISTNVTHFFRESRHFELLGRFARQWSQEGRTRFRFWSAACSTGEEPYSMAMMLREALAYTNDVKILATDISTEVVEKARAGIYSSKSLSNVPRHYAKTYFTKKTFPHGDDYRISSELQSMVTFGSINLSRIPYPLKGPLDIIFCRNVMIYFDNDVRRRLLAELYRLLRPGGYLMVGHAESLSGMLSEFKSIEPSVYIKR